MYVRIYIHTYMYTCIHIYIYTNIRIHIYVGALRSHETPPRESGGFVHPCAGGACTKPREKIPGVSCAFRVPAPVLFQYCFNAVSMLFQYCFNAVSILFQYCFNTVSILFQCCFLLFLTICSLQPTGCKLQPAGCSLQAASCSLQPAACRQPLHPK